jgi:hypothetical protein
LNEEKPEFTRQFLIWGNLGLAAWIFLAFFAVFLFNPIYGVFYLVFEALIIYVILRRLGCSSCYKCKTCTNGFGRLAGAFFGKGFVKKESVGNRFGAVAFVYFLLLVIPATVLFFMLSNAFSIEPVLVFVCLLAVATYSLTTWFTRSTVIHKI